MLAQQYPLKPLSAVEENLQCGICLDTLHTAKTLPCLHSFCVECISKHIECNEDHGVYKCPTCMNEHPIPTEGVHGLPTDFTKDELCRIVRMGKIASSKEQARHRMSQSSFDHVEDGRASPRACDLCLALDKEVISHSVATCLHCSKMLCLECKEQHQVNEATKLHSISDLQEQSSDVYCSKHNDDVLSDFCVPCSTFVCVVCIHGEHADHPCLDMTSVEPSLRNQLIRTLKSLNGDLRRLNGYLEFVENYNNALKETREDVHKRAEMEKDMIDKQKQELIMQLDKEAERRKQAVNEREHSIMGRLDQLFSNASEYKEQKEHVVSSIKTLDGVNNTMREKLKDAAEGFCIEKDKTIHALLKTGKIAEFVLSSLSYPFLP